jgi:hypothetical protein
MKLIGTELGRVLILIAAEEWRPLRGIPIGAAVSAIQAQFNFMIAPNVSELTAAQAESEGYKFQEGELDIDGEKTVIKDFIIFRDGFSVTTLETESAEAFLDNFLMWARESLGIRPFSRVPMRIFRSQLVVQFERPLSKAFRQFKELASIIERAYEAHTAYSEDVDIIRVDFGMDPTQLPGNIKPLPLVLERRVNRPHGDEVYFSEASLPSTVHLEVLSQIEGRFA